MSTSYISDNLLIDHIIIMPRVPGYHPFRAEKGRNEAVGMIYYILVVVLLQIHSSLLTNLKNPTFFAKFKVTYK